MYPPYMCLNYFDVTFGLTETASLASVGAGAPSVQRFHKEELFSRLDNATCAVATVLVAAIAIAVGDADGGAEGIIY